MVCDAEQYRNIMKIVNDISKMNLKNELMIEQNQQKIREILKNSENVNKHFQKIEDCLEKITVKIDKFLIEDYVPFKTKTITLIVVVSTFIGVLIGIGINIFF